ncbi:MAG TPA: hypothetical protein VLU46_04230, partial [Thermoanaerobaculia bacterium]|nr:hypothetical protein [Thermoanaerobaculia bacterium]
LAGVHATQPCSACHRNGVYAGTPRTCAGCHIARYNATTSPNHAAAGFPTTCDTCHKYTDATWQQAVFNHSSFPLAGAHTSQPCSACHKNNVYAGTPRTCVGCHQTDYNNSKNPSHVAAGFPTTCDLCHRFSDLSWTQAVFNHTWFPITSGSHAGRACNECHNVPTAFSAFTCITCHGRSETDSHHRQVGGYRYDSVACYACHPTGRSN